jgi:hypothetical protein
MLQRNVAPVRDIASPDNSSLYVAYGDGEVIGFTGTKDRDRDRSQRRIALA